MKIKISNAQGAKNERLARRDELHGQLHAVNISLIANRTRHIASEGGL